MKEQAYFAAIPIKVLQDNSIYHSYRILYGQIASYANTSGCCWATNETLGKAIDLSESSVSRGIKELAVRGHIKAYIDKETGNKRRIYPQQSSDIPDDEKGSYTLLYQELPTPPIRTHADRVSAPTPIPIRTHADIIEIKEKDKEECTAGVSIFFESSELENQAPQVNAKTLEGEQEPHIKENNICSEGLKEADYKQALMSLLKKFAKEYWDRPDIDTFLDYCWVEGKRFEIKKYGMKKTVPGLLELLKTHFEGDIGEMNKKKAEVSADHSDAERLAKDMIAYCRREWKTEYMTYERRCVERPGYIEEETEALKKLLIKVGKDKIRLIAHAFCGNVNEVMDMRWTKTAEFFKETFEMAEWAYNYYSEKMIPSIEGWVKKKPQ